ncbi:hypothetical protein Goari_017874 [Gossypium aridum]|uniref:O-fucosyltransferase family protein n=1 Tax=Gossypium aridum TaxID=34290 RepID=A0A7J8WN16_GOSAI|nr:hypothetical protein [Gossypium aridum]
MALPRRRNLSYNRFRSLVKFISAISGVLLILFAFLSFLAPSPNESQHFHLRHHHNSFNAVVEDPVTSGDSVFHVPVRLHSFLSSGGKLDRDIWSSRNAKFFYGCSNITDAVVAARILNATLVVPKLDQKSFWKDASNFSEIFDVDWFISSLSKDVKIIKQLPKRGGKSWTPYTMRVPRKCSERCYQNRVLPVILKRHDFEELLSNSDVDWGRKQQQ